MMIEQPFLSPPLFSGAFCWAEVGKLIKLILLLNVLPFLLGYFHHMKIQL
jgi:hypothetical protein